MSTMSYTDEEIFSQAIDLQQIEEQDRFVVSACGDNLEQRKRLLALLQSHRELANLATTFVLDRSEELHEALGTQEPDLTDSQVGPYRILHLLGEGGMGLVYLAEQFEPLRRRVALKVLKPGMNSRNVLARFELERQALAGMEHPGITRIVDAGLTDTGLPYFAMELVKGVAITDYCRSHRLAPRKRMELLSLVCSAIQHAHQRGIIHRDIKPSNVLVTEVDGVPQPKVIDFGIAKAVNDSINVAGHFTYHGELVGTPAYMSPEQALSSPEGVDVRTDVYSLGVLLYELMTGRTPLANTELKQRGLPTVRQLLNDTRFMTPSACVLEATEAREATYEAQWDGVKLHRFLKGEVDCVIRKALAIDRGERYQSVSDLQRDLERFLDDRPIEAVPPSISYRVRKLIRKHSALTTAAFLAVLLILSASATAIWFGLQAMEAKQIANERLQSVLQMQGDLVAERDRAIEAEKRTRLLAQSYLAPVAMDRALRRFCNEHFDELERANPDLEKNQGEVGSRYYQPGVLATLFNSNLLVPHSRLLVQDDAKWLLNVLSKVSEKDIKSLFSDSPFGVSTIEETTVTPAIGATVHVTPVLGEPLPDMTSYTTIGGAASPASDGVEIFSAINGLSPQYQFPTHVRLKYLQLVADELKGNDVPMLAETEDSIGLHLLEMDKPTDALQHFEESLRIRTLFPEQQLQLAQTNLYVADALMKRGEFASAREIIAQAQQALATISKDESPLAVEKLRELASTLEAKATAQ